jgi:hypothetical protein
VTTFGSLMPMAGAAFPQELVSCLKEREIGRMWPKVVADGARLQRLNWR